jgi:hypothetical protein
MLRRTYGNRSAWSFAFFFALWPYFSAVSLSGMENEAMVGTIALAAALCAARSPVAGLAIAVVAWMRPEGWVAAIILAMQSRGRDRLVAATLFVASLVALGLYFGSPIPQSGRQGEDLRHAWTMGRSSLVGMALSLRAGALSPDQ